MPKDKGVSVNKHDTYSLRRDTTSCQSSEVRFHYNWKSNFSFGFKIMGLTLPLDLKTTQPSSARLTDSLISNSVISGL